MGGVRSVKSASSAPVVELVRRQFGPLHLGSLPVGAVRELTTVERGALLTLARREGDPQQEIARHEADDSSSPDSQETSP